MKPCINYFLSLLSTSWSEVFATFWPITRVHCPLFGASELFKIIYQHVNTISSLISVCFNYGDYRVFEFKRRWKMRNLATYVRSTHNLQGGESFLVPFWYNWILTNQMLFHVTRILQSSSLVARRDGFIPLRLAAAGVELWLKKQN